MTHPKYYALPVWLAALSVLATPLLQATPAMADPASDEAQLKTIIEAIAEGWENADGAPFYAHYLGQDGARFIESGGQNEGLDDLVEHHVVPEGDVLVSMSLDFYNIEVHVEGDFAWAIADVTLYAAVKEDGRVIFNRGFEPFFELTPKA